MHPSWLDSTSGTTRIPLHQDLAKDHQGQPEEFKLVFSKPIDYTLGALFRLPPIGHRRRRRADRYWPKVC
jgi:hypothetical protein